VTEWYEATYGQRPTAAMAKALIINAAKDITGGTSGAGAEEGIPNGDEGWGVMYLPDIVNPGVNVVKVDSTQLLSTGQTYTTQVSYQTSSKPLKFTLVWTDAPGTAGVNPNLVNNLNLRVTAPGGQIWYGNSFSGGMSVHSTAPGNTDIAGEVWDANADNYDDKNNVECVYIPTTGLQSGMYTVAVIAQSVTTDVIPGGAVDQDFALVVYNGAQDTTATATGPIGSSNSPAVTITYTTVMTPTSVNLYYTKSTSAPYTWVLAGNDASVDGSYSYTITAGTGTYGWLASAVGGTPVSTEPSPPGNTVPPEASSFVLDTTAPTAPTGLTVHHYGAGTTGGLTTLTTAGTTAAGGPHNVWFALVDSNAASELTTPNSVTELTDAQYTAVSLSDDSRAGPSATPGVGVETFVKCQFATAINPATVTEINLTFEGYFSAALTGTLYAWNGVASTWDAIGATHDFLTTDTTMTRSITTSPGNYISGGYVLWGVFAGTARRSATVDYLAVAINNAVPYTTVDDNTLNWTASVSGDVDHYNIYRSDVQASGYTLIGSSPVGTNTYQDNGKGQADATRWWYRVRAVDAATNEETNTNSVQEPGLVVNPPYAISLSGKAANSWVFVSFPSGTSGAIQTILNDATSGDGLTTWTIAKWFNPNTPADPWKTYRVGGTANDMPNVNNTMGVWLWLTGNGGDQVLTMSSYVAIPASTGITLKAGWNLVGYPSMTNRLASVTLPAVAERVSVWSAASPYVTDYSDKSLVTMSHGNAYWVRVTADTTWTVTNP
jgi:hypothetical protein